LLKLVWKIGFPIYRYSNVEMIYKKQPPNIYDFEDLVIALKYHVDKTSKSKNPKIQKIMEELEKINKCLNKNVNQRVII